jgi:hypothetical protein
MKKKVWISLVIIALLGCSYALYSVYISYREVSSAYAAFLRAEERHLTSAVIPSIDQNPIRQELNQVLAEALSEGMAADARLLRAERGTQLLGDTERQIDMTMQTRDELILAIDTLRARTGLLGAILSSYDIPKVTALAEQQMVLVDDIRGLSYRANFHTGQIFERLIADRGILTPQHVISLNELIPKVEEQFDKRSNLYMELESLHDQVVE